MIEKLTVNSFKSLESVEVDLGQVNVFIGANGSGKSNLLEALGVLSAAADGKVNDQTLLQRGVRPGVPALYKSAFSTRIPPHIFFAAANSQVALRGVASQPAERTRARSGDSRPSDGRKGQEARRTFAGHEIETKPGTRSGRAQGRRVRTRFPALALLKHLQGYAIFEPTTPVLRGIASEPQPRKPVGMSGGQLPIAIKQLSSSAARDDRVRRVYEEALGLIDWAKAFGAAAATTIPLSSVAAASPQVIRFEDRYMRTKRNLLSGYDASEGALYVLFLAVIAAHELSPTLCPLTMPIMA